eukprot:m.251275 g.251275  ORF g.251275 m.251275 type:complete len:89 (-) comp17521_c0_seq5:1517-1783(-)
MLKGSCILNSIAQFKPGPNYVTRCYSQGLNNVAITSELGRFGLAGAAGDVGLEDIEARLALSIALMVAERLGRISAVVSSATLPIATR